MLKNILIILVLFLFSGPACAQTRVLVLGASVTAGCVGYCHPSPTEEGYLDRLRAMLPNYEFRAMAWSGAGILAWEPQSGPIYSGNGLHYPNFFGTGISGQSPNPIYRAFIVGEYGIENEVNLWWLLGRPHIVSWQPDYVLIVLGAGDMLRGGWGVPTGPQWGAAAQRLANGIVGLGSKPVFVFDTPMLWGCSEGHPVKQLFADYELERQAICNGETIFCGPDTLGPVCAVETWYGTTDGIHQGAVAHQAMADVLSAWFLAQE